MTDFLKNFFDFSNLLTFSIDMALVLLIGYVVGRERHEAGKTMGERSTIILIIGSYLFAYASLRCGIDHSRVIAQIVTGVGFIGAGIIFKKGEKDKAAAILKELSHEDSTVQETAKELLEEID